MDFIKFTLIDCGEVLVRLKDIKYITDIKMDDIGSCSLICLYDGGLFRVFGSASHLLRQIQPKQGE